MSIPELLRAAITRHSAGDLDAAALLYEQILALDAAQGDALNLLGVIAYQKGDYPAAEDYGRRAVAADPGYPAYQANLGNALAAQGQHEAAIAAFSNALAIDPRLSEAAFNLGNALLALGRGQEASAAYRQAIAAKPDYLEAYCNLAKVLLDTGSREEALGILRAALDLRGSDAARLDFLANQLLAASFYPEAQTALQRLVNADPGNAKAWQDLLFVLNLRKDFRGLLSVADDVLTRTPTDANALQAKAAALYGLKRYQEALECCQQAIARRDAFPEAHNLLGVILSSIRRLDEALAAVDRSIELNPGYAAGHLTRGEILRMLHRFIEARAAIRRSAELEPANPFAWSNLGSMESDLGNFAVARDCYQRALDWDAGFLPALSNKLFCLNYDPEISSDALYAAYAEVARRLSPPVRPRRHANKPNPGRRLRIGYLSADFANHVVRFFMEHLLEYHDRQAFELVLYDNTDPRDPLTSRFRNWAEQWRDARVLSDDELDGTIVRDQVDILVDLSGHTKGNRLAVLARKPAPVQVTYLGYGYTTGLDAVDYFLADPWFVPEGAERWFSERIFRLPRCMYCYRPPEGIPDIQSTPVVRNGYVTFGSLSRPIRYNDRVIDLWSEILAAVPESHLILDNRPFSDPGVCELFRDRFAARGITPERIVTRYTTDYWSSYHDIDIALDPFPHNAGTTTIEALWMGVPVLSLQDRPPLGRFGATLLHAVQMTEWLAESRPQYLEKAIAFGRDPALLEQLRRGLRARMEASSLRDEKGFVRAVETGYRQMWKQWCIERKK